MIDKLISLINGVDWANIGAQLLVLVTTISTTIVWFKKNTVDVKSLSFQGKELTEQIKHSKAQIVAYNNLINELSHYKKEVGKQIRNNKELNDKVDKLLEVVDNLYNKLEELEENSNEL